MNPFFFSLIVLIARVNDFAIWFCGLSLMAWSLADWVDEPSLFE